MLPKTIHPSRSFYEVSLICLLRLSKQLFHHLAYYCHSRLHQLTSQAASMTCDDASSSHGKHSPNQQNSQQIVRLIKKLESKEPRFSYLQKVFGQLMRRGLLSLIEERMVG